MQVEIDVIDQQIAELEVAIERYGQEGVALYEMEKIAKARGEKATPTPGVGLIAGQAEDDSDSTQPTTSTGSPASGGAEERKAPDDASPRDTEQGRVAIPGFFTSTEYD